MLSLVLFIFLVLPTPSHGQEFPLRQRLEALLLQDEAFLSERASVTAGTLSRSASLVKNRFDLSLSARGAYRLEPFSVSQDFPLGFTLDLRFLPSQVFELLSRQLALHAQTGQEQERLLFNQGVYRALLLGVQRGRGERELKALQDKSLRIERSYASARGIREELARETLSRADIQAELLGGEQNFEKINREALDMWGHEVPTLRDIEIFLDAATQEGEPWGSQQLTRLSVLQEEAEVERRRAEQRPFSLSAWLGGDITLPRYEDAALTLGVRLTVSLNRERERATLEALEAQRESKRRSAVVAELREKEEIAWLREELEVLKQRLILAEEAVAASQELVRLAEERFSAGSVSRNDLISAREAADARLDRREELYFSLLLQKLELFKRLAPLELGSGAP